MMTQIFRKIFLEAHSDTSPDKSASIHDAIVDSNRNSQVNNPIIKRPKPPYHN